MKARKRAPWLWGVQVVSWGIVFLLSSAPIFGLLAGASFCMFFVSVARCRQEQIPDALNPDASEVAAAAPGAPEATAEELVAALPDFMPAAPASPAPGAEKASTDEPGSAVGKHFRLLLKVFFWGACLLLLAIVVAVIALEIVGNDPVIFWAMSAVTAVLGGAVVVAHLLKSRLPVPRGVGFLLLVLGGISGIAAGIASERQAVFAALKEKLPTAESMELKERYRLFESLARFDPDNQGYRTQRDRLKVVVAEQEHKEANQKQAAKPVAAEQERKETPEEWAEKARARLAAEAEQTRKEHEKECAKLPRDPDAWAKAVSEGTLSPKRGYAKFYVQRQVACYPGDKKLMKQLAYMEAEEERVAQEEDAFQNPQNYLKLKTSWRTTEEGGNIMKADFRVQNTSTLPMKDIAIVCNMKAPSGTVVSVKRHTIYDTVKGGATRSFENVNMGFINNQASKASCRVEAAQAY